MEKLDMETKNILIDNIEKIGSLFPNVLINGKIDFELLKQELTAELIDDKKEKYQLTWPGKKECIVNANLKIKKTLRPIKEKSIDFLNTENVYIEGDNLDTLKILQESYLGKIKCIYIDPPYNTGKDFVYSDYYLKESREELLSEGLIDEYNNRLVTNMSSNGRFHSDWLSMMYPRLKLAKNLLKDDGMIFIHIDEHEINNLNKICSEIFGENNELGTIVWDKRNPKGSTYGVAYQHEYIIAFCKDLDSFSKHPFQKKKEHAEEMITKVKKLIDKYGQVNESVRTEYKRWINDNKKEFSGGEVAYSLIDDDGNIYQPVSMAAPDKPETRSHRPLIHPKTGKPCPVPEKGWRFTDETMDLLLTKNKIEFGVDETTQPRQKYYLKDNMFESVSSIIYYGGSDNIYGLPFDNPKPVYVVKKMLDTILDDGDIVLDFFAGSSTTAEAVLRLNSFDNKKRKYIMVQIPELCNENSSAYKNGYRCICDIGQQRIKKAIEDISTSDNSLIDSGFRVFRVDSSNMKDVYYKPSDISQMNLLDYISNIKEDRTVEDLLTQVMLDLGLTLDLKIEEKKILSNNVFYVEDNSLVACFDEQIDINIVEEICKCNPMKVVFKDTSFKTDKDKINLEEKIKKLSPDTEVSVL